MQQEPDTLHPMIGAMMAKVIVLGALSSGPIWQDDKLNYVAYGVESVPTLENGGAKFVGEGADRHLEVTCKVRKGLKWHDGTPVKASDAVYAWKVLMDPEFEVADRSFLFKLFEAKAVDDSTVVYSFMSEKQAKAAAAGTLKGAIKYEAFKDDYGLADFDKQTGPVVDPLYFLACGSQGGGWLPEHILGKVAPKDHAKNPWSTKPVLDGPYKLKEWKPAQEIVLEANPDWPLGAPKIKTIVIRIISDSNAILAALQKGEIDAATQIGLNVDMSPELDKIEATKKYKAWYVPAFTWEHLDINTTKFPFDDLKVRQALAYATDKKSLIDKLYFGKATAADSFLPKFHWAYGGDQLVRYDFSLDKAKSLLKDAGWTGTAAPLTKKVTEAGKEVTKRLIFTLQTTDRADRQRTAQVLQSQWKAAGFGAQMQFLLASVFFGTASAGGPLYSRTFEVGEYAWVASDDPDVSSLYTCKSIPTKENKYSGQNFPGWCNKEADSLITKAASDVDIALSRDKRKPLYIQIQKIWTSEVPVIPLYNYTVVYVSHVGLKNFQPTPTQYGPETYNAWTWELVK